MILASDSGFGLDSCLLSIAVDRAAPSSCGCPPLPSSGGRVSYHAATPARKKTQQNIAVKALYEARKVYSLHLEANENVYTCWQQNWNIERGGRMRHSSHYRTPGLEENSVDNFGPSKRSISPLYNPQQQAVLKPTEPS